jgi:peptidoglycan/LPS O-acetylase OafA/YrhL
VEFPQAAGLAEQNGFSGQVNLNCTVNGSAPLATCSVSPSSVTLGSTPSNSTLTITAPTTLTASALPLNEGSRNIAYAVILPFPALLLGGIGLASWRFRKRRSGLWYLGGSVFVVFAVLAGCGGGGIPAQTPKNYMVTVNAMSASGSVQHSTTVTITVQ